MSPPFRSNIAGAPHNLEALPAEPLPNFLTIALARAQQSIFHSKWMDAASAYGKWLNAHSAVKLVGAQFAVSSLRIDRDDLLSLPALLQHEYERMAAGDLLLLDVPAATRHSDGNTMTRDSLATALFRGGFEKPLMWGGRKALVAELQRGRWLGGLLPAKALGAGPDRVPEIAGGLVPPSDRIYAIVRRSAQAPPEQRPLRLSVIMPVYNERKTFRDVMDALLVKIIPGIDIEICLVESNSSDGTREEVLRYADHPRVRLLLEGKPSGKGHAVRAGIALATGDILLIQDADLEYNLNDYEKLLEPLCSYRSSFVLGSRHTSGEFAWQIRKFIGQNYIADFMNFGHLFFAGLINFMFGQRLRDPFTMYKVFRRDCIHSLRFECNRFDFDIELVAKLLRCGYRPLEIDIHYQSRSFEEGKKVSVFRDPPTWIKACLKHRFSTLYAWPESQPSSANGRPKGSKSTGRLTLRLGQIVYALARRIYRALPLQDQTTKLRLRSKFLRYFGFLLPKATADFAAPPITSQKRATNPESLDIPGPFSWSNDPTAYFLSPTDQPLHDDGYSVSRFMYHVWSLRPDLRQAFDLYDRDSRVEFCKWFLLNASDEYALPDQIYSDELLIKLASTKGPAATRAQAILDKRNKLGLGRASITDEIATESELVSDLSNAGANLIGYCRGEFGMGQVVRSTARAFDAVQTPFSMIDNQNVGSHGFGDESTRHWITNIKKYRTNIFCINADSLPLLYFSLGRSLFTNSYNIGYWAWELSKCPPEFNLSLAMMDEVWGISEFVAESFRTRSTVPVFNMPLAVSLPVLQRQYSKSYFGLSENCFQFLFTFDAASYVDRKNPIATVRAFRLAFPRGDEKVHLLIKTMNTHSEDPIWSALVAETKIDARIAIMDKRLTRDEVLGLNFVCDAFVSLHRSEGFGFNLAEAMLMGKPVIATNYSGSREFAREDTVCVVDYRLVSVPEHTYPFSQEQVWAEPDIEHAAVLMRRLTYDDTYREKIARSGQRFVSDNFNEAKIGTRYAARLEDIKSKIIRSALPQQSRRAAMAPLASDVDDEIAGYIDLPMPDGSRSIHAGSIEIAGWVASKLGIQSVEIYCDGTSLGIAHYGILRPDIAKAFPNFKDAGRSGFFWMLDATSLATGIHVVRVVARSRSGRLQEWTRDFMLASTTPYQQWVTTNALGSKEKKNLVARAKRLTPKSTITIVMVSKSDVDHDAISRSMVSLAGQIYQNFRLVIVVPVKEETQHIQSAVAATGMAERLHLVFSERPHWLESRDSCDGDFVGVMDIGDVLEPRALMAVAENIARDSSIDLLYADEDRIDNGVRTMPVFKPAFSPIYLDRHNYIGRPWFARTALIKEATGEVEPNTNLSEHALLKYLGRSARAVCHIPMVLVSRPLNTARSACADSRPAEDATLSKAAANESWPRISVVIPTCLHERDIATRCFNALVERTDYPNLEVIVVVNNVPDMAAAQAFLANWPFTVRIWEGAFNWSAINNFGARSATGDYILCLNDDVEPVDPGWLKHMVRIGRVPSVGAVGATLKYSNKTLQHAGITISNHAGAMRHCGRHVFRFCSGDEAHIAPLTHHDHECRAVTGACLLTRRDCFDAVNGFDENLALVTNDTDYCLRLAEKGYSSVIASGAVLIHDEGISRGGMAEDDDIKQFWKRWAARLSAVDPFTNPNLDIDKDDWSINAGAVGPLIGRIRRQGDVSRI